MTSLELRIYGSDYSMNKSTQHLDVIDSFGEVPIVTYVYLWTTITIVAIIITTAISWPLCHTRHYRNTSLIVRNYFESIWSIFETSIDQENYSPSIDSVRITWLAVCLSILFVVQGVFLCILSTDLIAEIQPDQIDNLDTLLQDSQFANVRPILLSEFQFYDIIRSSKVGSPFEQVYQRSINTGNCSGDNQDNIKECNLLKVMPKDLQKFIELMNVANVVRSGDRVIIGEDNLIDYAFFISCVHDPTISKGIHRSTESLANMYETMFFSKQLNYEIYRYATCELTRSLDYT